MYLWKTSKLVDELKAGTVSEKDKMLYVMISGIAATVISDPILSIGLKYSVIDGVSLICLITIGIIGTLHVYKKNRDGDNRDFITRFVCLSVPTGARLILVAATGGVLFGLVDEFSSTENQAADVGHTTPVYLALFMLLISGYFFRYLGKRMQEVATSAMPNPSTGTSR